MKQILHQSPSTLGQNLSWRQTFFWALLPPEELLFIFRGGAEFFGSAVAFSFAAFSLEFLESLCLSILSITSLILASLSFAAFSLAALSRAILSISSLILASLSFAAFSLAALSRAILSSVSFANLSLLSLSLSSLSLANLSCSIFCRMRYSFISLFIAAVCSSKFRCSLALCWVRRSVFILSLAIWCRLFRSLFVFSSSVSEAAKDVKNFHQLEAYFSFSSLSLPFLFISPISLFTLSISSLICAINFSLFNLSFSAISLSCFSFVASCWYVEGSHSFFNFRYWASYRILRFVSVKVSWASRSYIVYMYQPAFRYRNNFWADLY